MALCNGCARASPQTKSEYSTANNGTLLANICNSNAPFTTLFAARPANPRGYTHREASGPCALPCGSCHVPHLLCAAHADVAAALQELIPAATTACPCRRSCTTPAPEPAPTSTTPWSQSLAPCMPGERG